MPCESGVCGTGGWDGPKPGDPNNSSILSATPAFGGIDVSWTYPDLNPAAVAHTILYRGLTPSFLSAVQYQIVSGGFFYDKMDTGLTYYYWISIISVNGTVGAIIGPASATARPLIGDLIEQLTNQIDAGVLAQSLKTEIARISLIDGDIVEEIQNRLSSYQVLSAAFAQVQATADEAMTFVGQEIIQRTEGESALVASMDVLYSKSDANVAALLQETKLRTDKDTALGSRIDTLAVATGTAIAAAVQTETTARVNANSSLASQITTAQSALNTSIASAQTTLQTNINAVDDIVDAMYTAKVTVNGLIGGFGLHSDGTAVDAGFDVDTFWVGRTATNKKKPFIIVGTEVFINEAVIEKLVFDKLRAADGSVIVENGKIIANYLNVKGINVVDITGSPSFSIDTVGNAFFRGNLEGSTGTFAGTLRAGVLDMSVFSGITQTYITPGTYTLTVPNKPEWTGVSMRVTLQGAGGGGSGGNYSRVEGQSIWGGWGGKGGAAGARVIGTLSNVTPGATYTLVVGMSGVGSLARTIAPGTPGAKTEVVGFLSATGGIAGVAAAPHYPNSASASGTAGVSSSQGAGGLAGFWDGGIGGIGGIGAGGGGGGGHLSSSGADRAGHGGNGGSGHAIIEFFDPNTVVMNARYSALIAWLETLGHGVVPAAAR